MSAHDSFMPVFEAFTSNTADGMNESAEDSEGDEAGETSTAAKKRQNAKSSLPDAEVGDKRKRARGKGKRKIAIEYIKDKKSRAVTFTKRKAGIFTKARELSTLTGSSVLLLVVSESGVVYTYTTEKFQPMVTQDAGKNMIAACLNGKVNLDDRFHSVPSRGISTSAPKRGGDILLKDAFASDSPVVSSSTWRPAENEVFSDGAHPEENGATNIASAPYQADTRTFPSVPLPPLPLPSSSLAQIMNDDEIDLVQVPRLAKRPRVDYLSYPDSNQAINDHIEEEDDDLSEGQCEAHMRQIRRSLSLERRFEKVAEEERPRLLKRDEGENTNTSNAFAEQDDVNQHHTHNNYSGRNGEAFAGINELRRDGFSFTATADAWDSIRDRFHLNDTKPQQHDHIAHGWGSMPASSSRALPEQRASRRPRQMMTLEELPPT